MEPLSDVKRPWFIGIAGGSCSGKTTIARGVVGRLTPPGAALTLAGRISPNGQRSFPQEERTKPSPDWNHYRVVANNGDISLSVNGKEVTIAKAASPRKGYLMLESEGSEAHFRNVRIKELPSTNPRPEEIARVFVTFQKYLYQQAA